MLAGADRRLRASPGAAFEPTTPTSAPFRRTWLAPRRAAMWHDMADRFGARAQSHWSWRSRPTTAICSNLSKRAACPVLGRRAHRGARRAGSAGQRHRHRRGLLRAPGWPRGWRNRAAAPDLMVANNVLAHVPDINDFVAGFATAAGAANGVATFEFPHLLQLVRGQSIRHDLSRAFFVSLADRRDAHLRPERSVGLRRARASDAWRQSSRVRPAHGHAANARSAAEVAEMLAARRHDGRARRRTSTRDSSARQNA